MLFCIREGKERVIAYASRGLKNSERNYPAHKLEFLALKWSVTDKFKDMLYGNTFEVVTDNNPLTYVLTSAKLDAAGQRWITELAEYDFTIRYRSGKKNVDADVLSRLPAKKSQSFETISKDSIRAVMCNCQIATNLIEAVAMNISVADQVPEEEDL